MLDASTIKCNFEEIFSNCESVDNLTEVFQAIDKELKNAFANASFKLTMPK